MLLLPIHLLLKGYFLVHFTRHYPGNGLLIWLILFKATMGGLGSSRHKGGMRGVGRCSVSPTDCPSPPAPRYSWYYSFMHLLAGWK